MTSDIGRLTEWWIRPCRSTMGVVKVPTVLIPCPAVHVDQGGGNPANARSEYLGGGGGGWVGGLMDGQTKMGSSLMERQWNAYDWIIAFKDGWIEVGELMDEELTQ